MTVHNDVDLETLRPEEHVPRGTALHVHLTHIQGDVGLLQHTLESLPAVSFDGRSSVIDAEDRYARKEELEARVAGHVQRLGRWLTELSAEIDRHVHNLARIDEDQASLHLTKAVEYYSRADLAQRDQCYLAEKDCEAVVVVMAEAEAVLAVSQKHKFPGRAPKRTGAELFLTQPRIGGSRDAPLRPADQREIDGLLGMGPVSREEAT